MNAPLLRLWLGGMALRLTFLAVPPVLPLIGGDLGLSATSIGLLTGAPVLMLGIAALLGSLLIVTFGAQRSIFIGLTTAGVASALRGIAPEIWSLDAATLVMGAGIAAAQPAMAAAVRDWLPGRVGFGTAVYTNGLLVGEILPVALTIPVVLPLVGASWRWSLVVWSIPLFAIAALFPPARDRLRTRTARRAAWWPNWRSMTLWRIGLLFGCTNALYFVTNGFIPSYLQGRGEGGTITAVLTALNLGQLPASFLLLAIADRVQGRLWPFVFAGVCSILSVIGLLVTSGVWLVAAGGVLGFACALAVITGLALPADDQHARRPAAHGVGHVHDQLCGRGGVVAPLRPHLGSDRFPRRRVRAAGLVRNRPDRPGARPTCAGTARRARDGLIVTAIGQRGRENGAFGLVDRIWLPIAAAAHCASPRSSAAMISRCWSFDRTMAIGCSHMRFLIDSSGSATVGAIKACSCTDLAAPITMA